MSQPRFWWYGSVKKAIMHSEEFKDSNLAEYQRWNEAIKKAFDEISSSVYSGDDRAKAVFDILIRQTETVESEAMKLHYGERTVRGWVNEFVNLTGYHKGYEPTKSAQQGLRDSLK